MIAPAVVIRPILWPFSSVNHSAPSGPAVIPAGWLIAVGTSNSVTADAVAGTSSATNETSTGAHARDRCEPALPVLLRMPSMANFRVAFLVLRTSVRRPYPGGGSRIKSLFCRSSSAPPRFIEHPRRVMKSRSGIASAKGRTSCWGVVGRSQRYSLH